MIKHNFPAIPVNERVRCIFSLSTFIFSSGDNSLSSFFFRKNICFTPDQKLNVRYSAGEYIHPFPVAHLPGQIYFFFKVIEQQSRMSYIADPERNKLYRFVHILYNHEIIFESEIIIERRRYPPAKILKSGTGY